VADAGTPVGMDIVAGASRAAVGNAVEAGSWTDAVVISLNL